MALTIRTDLGDIKVELFCEQTPRCCENFLALCASDYYNGCLFHRNIKGFIVQTGDPTGTGKGGISIWGRKFEDEFSEHLKVSKHSLSKSFLCARRNVAPSESPCPCFVTQSVSLSLSQFCDSVRLPLPVPVL
ncbi:peptidyl-prolyl cis-trans isomerase-like 3 [Heptranchias perlo]|uniref:peptidyl-prolyl cis-trans isomerase-like 3 n=1 Tax=Heptranchias perlo TaxID=212740 RepID=UPI00355961C4